MDIQGPASGRSGKERSGGGLRRILIAGCGELGIAVGLRLAARGDQVVGLRRSAEMLPAEFERIQADLRGDPRDLPNRFDAVVYCATPSSRDEIGYRDIYILAQQRLRDHVRCARWLFVSSTAVYADGGQEVDEASVVHSNTFNGRVLREAEGISLAAPDGRCVRLAGIYGPGREMLLRRLRRGEPAARAQHFTNRIHVDDAAALCVRLLEDNVPPIVNGVDDAPSSEAEVLAWLAAAMGLPELPIVCESPSGKRVSNALARSLGWRPAYSSYQQGYAAMLAAQAWRGLA